MEELKVWVHGFELFPEPPYPKVAFPRANAVKEHDPRRAHFGEPAFTIALHRIICMVAIDVKEVDAYVFKIALCILEVALNKLREPGVEGVMVRSKVRQDFRSVGASVRISLPGADGVTRCRDAKLLHRLAEGAIGDSAVCTQLYHKSGTQNVYEEHAERHVLYPIGGSQSKRRGKANRMVKRVQ